MAQPNAQITDEIASIVFTGYFENALQNKEQCETAIQALTEALQRLRDYKETLDDE